MGYIRKHKNELRSGFEACIIVGATVALAPMMIMFQVGIL
jgi:hypothetical protein